MKLGCGGWAALFVLVALGLTYPVFGVIELLSICGIVLFVVLSTRSKRAKPGPVDDYAPADYVPPAALQRLKRGFEFDIVGESFRQENFESLRRKLRAKYGDEVFVDVLLINDPKNPYSRSGHAVAVHCRGLLLGYIPEDSNTEFFSLIKTVGGSVECSGRIYFDSHPDHDRNSVRIFTGFPPELDS